MNRFFVSRISRFVLLVLMFFGLALTPVLQSCSSPPQEWEIVVSNISFLDPGDSEESPEAPEIDFLVVSNNQISTNEVDAWLSDVLSAMKLGESAKISDFSQASDSYKFITELTRFPVEGTIVKAINSAEEITGKFTLHADD
jgi:hypothetical protein